MHTDQHNVSIAGGRLYGTFTDIIRVPLRFKRGGGQSAFASAVVLPLTCHQSRCIHHVIIACVRGERLTGLLLLPATAFGFSRHSFGFCFGSLPVLLLVGIWLRLPTLFQTLRCYCAPISSTSRHPRPFFWRHCSGRPKHTACPAPHAREGSQKRRPSQLLGCVR